MIEAEKGRDCFAPNDGGKTWAKLDASHFMVWRPFYFANLIVDPKDENKIFKPDLPLAAEREWRQRVSALVASAAHGDFHDVWIDPKNPNIVITGDDGGLWRSEDGGTRWKHQMNLPVSQFYHVSVDNCESLSRLRRLAGQQRWVGDSSYPGGVTQFALGKHVRRRRLLGVRGHLRSRLHLRRMPGRRHRPGESTHAWRSRGIKPLPNYGEKKLRFNWNTPIHMSPNEKGTIYIGAQFLFRSRDHGQSWERISPDLTTNDPEKQKQEESGGVTVDNSSAEMHTTIYSISESPKNGQIIWVGTDDGNLQITRDGAKTWTNVVGNIAGWRRIPGSRPSRPAASTKPPPTPRSIATHSAT